MSYQAQALLTNDTIFGGRVQSCTTQQAETFKDDQRQNFVAVAEGILRGSGELFWAFIRICAAGPGIADKADNGDGTISQENVTDADLLSLTQASWQVVADLYFTTDGAPI
jgi:hypothetical protein